MMGLMMMWDIISINVSMEKYLTLPYLYLQCVIIIVAWKIDGNNMKKIDSEKL